MDSAAFETSDPKKMVEKVFNIGRMKKLGRQWSVHAKWSQRSCAVISHVAKDTCQSKTISLSVLDGEREDRD